MTLYGKEARTKILDGVRKISSAVKVTLGPMGRNVLISQSMVIDYGVHSLPIHVTKDGYTTTKGFDLDDPFEKAGVLLVKEAAQKTVDEAGDGTSTTVVLLEAIVEEAIKRIDEGANPMELKKSIDREVEYVVVGLKSMAVQVGEDNEKLFNIATISANNDPEIGRLISDAFNKIGKEGVIDIEMGKTSKTEIKIADGYRFERSYISPWFMTNREKQTCEFENPLILLYEKMVTHHTQIERALTISIQQGRPILIICEDSKEEGLGYLISNTIQGRVKCCVVKSPSYGEMRREDMEDLAILTGGSYISDSKGLGISEIEFQNFGQASKVLITKEETIIIGGRSDKDALQNLLNELRMNLVQAKNEEEKAPIEKRIAKLQGGIAVIQVGAATETELKEKMDRFDDAVRATKAAISEGYVPGGGTAFLRLINRGIRIDIDTISEETPIPMEDVLRIYDQTGMEFYKTNTEDILTGIIFSALKAPLIQICKNAGVGPDKILMGVSSQIGPIGYNAKTDTIEDLVKAGVIDPVKVLRCALQNAASAASMIITTECLIADTL